MSKARVGGAAHASAGPPAACAVPRGGDRPGAIGERCGKRGGGRLPTRRAGRRPKADDDGWGFGISERRFVGGFWDVLIPFGFSDGMETETRRVHANAKSSLPRTRFGTRLTRGSQGFMLCCLKSYG